MVLELLQANWPGWSGLVDRGPSGWNNDTSFVHNGDRSSVLRIYNTHRDRSKIEFELAVLDFLQRKGLPFCTPVPIPAVSGERIIQVRDGSGRFAVLFSYIAGERPEANGLEAAVSFGERTGELTKALAETDIGLLPAYPPYYELLGSYPSCTKERVHAFCGDPLAEFERQREDLATLRLAYDDIVGRLDVFRELPQQLVHGDLNASNLLVDRDRAEVVTALLDFEFCTRDVRAMEPAVVISGYLGTQGEREAVNRFCLGFGSRMRLGAEEVRAIPALIRLRLVDVFLHFLTRYEEGTDKPDVLQKQIGMLAAALRRFEDCRPWLDEALTTHML